MSEEVKKMFEEGAPEISMKTDGLVVNLTQGNRRAILGIEGQKYFVPSVAIREGTKIIFVVAQEESMPSREVCLKLKEQGLLIGLPVKKEEIEELNSGERECIQFNIVKEDQGNRIAFMVDVCRREDLKK